MRLPEASPTLEFGCKVNFSVIDSSYQEINCPRLSCHTNLARVKGMRKIDVLVHHLVFNAMRLLQRKLFVLTQEAIRQGRYLRKILAKLPTGNHM
ncbi:hypothetical protein D3C87_1557300 [compost metagenome]